MHHEAIDVSLAEFDEVVKQRKCPALNELGEQALVEVRSVYEQMDAGNYEGLGELAARLAMAAKKENPVQDSERSTPEKPAEMHHQKKELDTPAMVIEPEAATRQQVIDTTRHSEIFTSVASVTQEAETQHNSPVIETHPDLSGSSPSVVDIPKESYDAQLQAFLSAQQYEVAQTAHLPQEAAPQPFVTEQAPKPIKELITHEQTTTIERPIDLQPPAKDELISAEEFIAMPTGHDVPDVLPGPLPIQETEQPSTPEDSPLPLTAFDTTELTEATPHPEELLQAEEAQWQTEEIETTYDHFVEDLQTLLENTAPSGETTVENNETDVQSSEEALEPAPPILTTVTEVLSDASPETKTEVAPIIQELTQAIATIQVLEQLPTPEPEELEAAESKIEELCVNLLETLCIEYDEQDIQQLVHAIKRLAPKSPEPAKQITIDLEHTGTHEAKYSLTHLTASLSHLRDTSEKLLGMFAFALIAKEPV